MKCRDCENLIWSYDEGEWIWHCKECYCPDLDIERDCPDFAPKKPDIFIALSTLQAENKKLREKIEEACLEGYVKGFGKMSEENEKLRAEADGMRSNWYKAVEEVKKLRAELEQVKREGKIPRYTIGDTVYDCFGRAWEVTSVELHSMRAKNEWLYRCGHNGTDDYCALWHFEAFPSKEAALRREQDGQDD